MPNLSPWVATTHLTLDPANFVDVIAPINCDGVVIYNKAGIDMLMRCDPADPNTENLLFGGAQQTFTSTKGIFSPGVQRFKKGQPIVSLKPASGTGPAVLLFLT